MCRVARALPVCADADRSESEVVDRFVARSPLHRRRPPPDEPNSGEDAPDSPLASGDGARALPPPPPRAAVPIRKPPRRPARRRRPPPPPGGTGSAEPSGSRRRAGSVRSAGAGSGGLLSGFRDWRRSRPPARIAAGRSSDGGRTTERARIGLPSGGLPVVAGLAVAGLVAVALVLAVTLGRSDSPEADGSPTAAGPETVAVAGAENGSAPSGEEAPAGDGDPPDSGRQPPAAPSVGDGGPDGASAGTDPSTATSDLPPPDSQDPPAPPAESPERAELPAPSPDPPPLLGPPAPPDPPATPPPAPTPPTTAAPDPAPPTTIAPPPTTLAPPPPPPTTVVPPPPPPTTLAPPPPPPVEPDWGEIARSVVLVWASGCNGAGSGTVVLDGQHVLTNAHVVLSDAGQVCTGLSVGFSDRIEDEPNEWISASLVAHEGGRLDSDGNTTLPDLAVLRLNRSPELPAIAIASQQLRLNEEIVALGFPRIGGTTVTLVAGKFAGIGEDNGHQVLKTDADISPGNSGGAAFNSDGVFVGVPTFTFVAEDRGTDLGYLIPAAEAAAFLARHVG